MKKKIFITGLTGFVGHEILKNLNFNNYHVYALSRKDLSKSENSHENITYIQGDLSELNLGLSEADLLKISDTEIVLHLGAYYDLKGSFASCFMNNVAGTRNLLTVFNSFESIKEFHFVSSIAIFDPLNNSHFQESSFPERSNFSDHYSHSKYLSEKLFREYQFNHDVHKVIYRPGIITAHSLDPKNFKMDGPYYLAKFVKNNVSIMSKIPYLPLSFNNEATIPIVNVDYVARVILSGLEIKKKEKLKTYHLLTKNMIKLDSLVQLILKEFDVHTQVINTELIKNSQGLLFKFLNIPTQIIPFMFHSNTYDTSCTINDFKETHCLSFNEYQDVFLKSLKNV